VTPGAAHHPARVVVAGMGSEYRRDDGAGPAVVEQVVRDIARGGGGRGPEPIAVGPFGDPLDLLGSWDGASLAVVVDATRSGAPAGTVRVYDLDAHPAPERPGTPASTHGLGVLGALHLARAVGTAPDRVLAVGIEGADFGPGVGLTPAVQRSVPLAARRVLELVGWE